MVLTDNEFVAFTLSYSSIPLFTLFEFAVDFVVVMRSSD
jgi:hypothetical protein